MGQVTVVLNGRTYRLECGEGEESHLIALAEYLGEDAGAGRDLAAGVRLPAAL